MIDEQTLVDNENPDDSVLTFHGAPVVKGNLYRVMAALSIAPIAVGLTLSYSSGAIESIKDDPNMTPTANQLSWFGSIITVGAAIGALLAGLAIEKFGRKCVILVANGIFVIGWMLLVADISSIETAIVGRFKTGLATGIMSIAVPTYIGETATNDVRGSFGAGYQLMITLGLMLGFLAGRWLGWQHAALFSMCFVFVSTVTTWLFVPSSPRWLLMKKDRTSAKKNLAYLRSLDPNGVMINRELEEMEQSVLLQAQHGNASIREILTTRHLRTPLLIMLVVHVGQQMTGINCILFYAESIFADAGMTDANLASILLGATQFLGTLVSSLLMDKRGRRFWLFTSVIGMVICLVVFGVYENYQIRGAGPAWMEYVGLASIVLFSFAFALGEGPVPWLLVGEFFDGRAKGACSSLCGLVNWGSSFLLTFFLAQMLSGLGQDWTYWFFAMATALIGVFEVIFLPETRGKSLEEIASQFQ